MDTRELNHLLRCVLLLVLLYVISRLAAWTGPRSNIEFVPELLWPGILLISFWGLWRLLSKEC